MHLQRPAPTVEITVKEATFGNRRALSINAYSREALDWIRQEAPTVGRLERVSADMLADVSRTRLEHIYLFVDGSLDFEQVRRWLVEGFQQRQAVG